MNTRKSLAVIGLIYFLALTASYGGQDWQGRQSRPVAQAQYIP